MSRQRRSNDWGFPRWRAYDGAGTTADVPRRCDREGCTQPGICPAPKAPDRPERWHFCAEHAAEYNRSWNYFDAAGAAAAAAHEQQDAREARAWRRSAHWNWGEGDGSRSQSELDALRLFGLAPDAGEQDVKAAHRRMAKANHPDLNPGDAAAAARFQAAQAAYEVLREAGRRRKNP
jgi:hypothetical protein